MSWQKWQKLEKIEIGIRVYMRIGSFLRALSRSKVDFRYQLACRVQILSTSLCK